MILHSLLLRLIGPVLRLVLVWRQLTGRAAPFEAGERLGKILLPPGTGPLVWLHGASNGELASARPLIDELIGCIPDLRFVVTANTPTGRALAAGWGLGSVRAGLAPIDSPGVLARFLATTAPAVLVTMESELWPNRMEAARLRGIPVILAGARMSARAEGRWHRYPAIAARILGAVTWLSAQDAASEARFAGLGIPADRIGPLVNLKAVAGKVAASATDGPDWPRPTTVLAASTHDGEEQILLRGYRLAQATNPALRMILAPRHPARRDAVEALLRAEGIDFATRSRGQRPTSSTEVYLADTLGEMPAWYAAAGITFVGGSLVSRGGHTPFEPALHHSAMISGPDVTNFAEAYRALRDGDAIDIVASDGELAEAFRHLADPATQDDRVARATAALAPLAPGDGLRQLALKIAGFVGARRR